MLNSPPTEGGIKDHIIFCFSLYWMQGFFFFFMSVKIFFLQFLHLSIKSISTTQFNLERCSLQVLPHHVFFLLSQVNLEFCTNYPFALFVSQTFCICKNIFLLFSLFFLYKWNDYKVKVTCFFAQHYILKIHSGCSMQREVHSF